MPTRQGRIIGRSVDKIRKTARLRYLHQSQTVGQGPEFMKSQVRNSSSWEPDWSLAGQHALAQIEFANYLDQELPPQAMAILNTPTPLHPSQFRTQLQTWRVRSAKLHRGVCPPRRDRKIEYIASLEYGFNPCKAPTGRLHAHVLLYNLGSILLADLGEQWRKLHGIKDLNEPVITPYTPGPEGILYALKAYGSDADMIYFSPKLSLPATADPGFCGKRSAAAGFAASEA